MHSASFTTPLFPARSPQQFSSTLTFTPSPPAKSPTLASPQAQKPKLDASVSGQSKCSGKSKRRVENRGKEINFKELQESISGKHGLCAPISAKTTIAQKPTSLPQFNVGTRRPRPNTFAFDTRRSRNIVSKTTQPYTPDDEDNSGSGEKKIRAWATT